MIQGMSHFLALPFDWERVMFEITRLLSAAGLQAVRSFDLQSARAAHLAYTCPHHGTDGCNCQLIMLLVYGQARSPVTLVVYGWDGQTWASIVNQTEQRADPRQETSVLRTLSPGNFNFVSQGEAPGIA